MPRVAAIFPGQGSQSVGMGGDIARKSAQAGALFDRASAVLGYDLLALTQDGPEEKLRETQYSQPAIFVTNLALYEAARSFVRPVASAGHSFGELCSLTISGAISFDDALRIVSERGKAMQQAAEMAAGAMSAVLGLEATEVREVVESIKFQTGARLQLANFNSPAQIVISGEAGAVQQAGDAMLQAGAKRVVPLNVSGAWHSKLMEPAVPPFARAVASAHFSAPEFAVISNVDAQPYRTADEIREKLVLSITNEVRWHDTSEKLVACGLDLVVEFGADGRGVLTPLMKRLPGAPAVAAVSDWTSCEKLRLRLEEPARV